MATRVTLDADITEVNEVPKYRLYGRCTARGSLPDAHLFLTEIVDEDAPEDDLLYRVIQLSDLDPNVGYGTDRDEAVRNGVSYWRASQFANYYDDVEVAANAKQVLKDEINALVSDYATYSDQFEAVSEEVDFPNATTGAVDALKAAYDTALTEYQAAQVAQTSANETLEDAEDDLTEIETWLGRKDQLETDLAARTAEITTAKSLYNTFLGTSPGAASDAAWIITRIESFISAYDTSGSGVDTERDGLEDDKNNFAAQRTKAKSVDVDDVIALAVSNHSAMEADINSYIPTTVADQTTAETAVTTAQTAKVAADADVAAKYVILEAAYDAVKAVCPDWTPDEPLPAEPAA